MIPDSKSAPEAETKNDVASTADLEFERALAISAKALRYAQAYRTPPVPKTYEIWYAFASGKPEGLRKEVSTLIEKNDLFCQVTRFQNSRFGRAKRFRRDCRGGLGGLGCCTEALECLLIGLVLGRLDRLRRIAFGFWQRRWLLLSPVLSDRITTPLEFNRDRRSGDLLRCLIE